MNNKRRTEKPKLTPEDIKKLAKFFGLLWETHKAQKGCNETQKCNRETRNS